MSSVVDICNMALSRLSAKRIQNITDNTIEALQCNAVFNQVSKFVQASGPWTCNKFRVALAQSTTTPAFGFAYQYPLPTDPLCLRVLLINEDVLGDINYQIEGGNLLTDETAVGILYIGWVTDTQAFDPYLEEAIVDQLTAEISFKITGQASYTKGLFEAAEKHRQELLNIGSVQGSSTEWPSNTFVDVRRSI